jgi:hypothetical protein
MRRSLIPAVLLLAGELIGVRYGFAGQAPAAASDPGDERRELSPSRRPRPQARPRTATRSCLSSAGPPRSGKVFDSDGLRQLTDAGLNAAQHVGRPLGAWAGPRCDRFRGSGLF